VRADRAGGLVVEVAVDGCEELAGLVVLGEGHV
jgi:hypothetical protein